MHLLLPHTLYGAKTRKVINWLVMQRHGNLSDASLCVLLYLTLYSHME